MTAPIEYRQEVRFAVVMYGGVSLAIYINGIAQELLRLVRATAKDPADPGRSLAVKAGGTEAVYRRIGQLLGRQGAEKRAPWSATDPIHTRFVVDIVSGTSAGGINGIYLAKALANGQSLDQLKGLWVTEGDLEVLLNDKRSIQGVRGLDVQKPPQALLNGERLYRKLVDAFDGMDQAEAGSPPRQPLVDEVDLFVTTTDIRGLPLPLKLADGVVWENRHRNVFHFRFERSDPVNDSPKSNPLNDFAAAYNPMLAFAARCTSSFPFAFEPYEFDDMDRLLPAGLPADDARRWQDKFFPFYHLPEGARRPDGRLHPEHAYDPAKRAFGDGGYLDNKPFSYAIDTLAKRTSELPVQRKLLYVEPSPDHPEDQEEPPERPNVVENVNAALSLARYETIREDLQRILERNRLIERVEHFLSGMEEDFRDSGRKLAPSDHFSDTDLRQRIKDFGPSYGGYHRLKVAAVTDDVASWIARAARFDLESDQFLAIRLVARAWRGLNFVPVPAAGEKAASHEERLDRVDVELPPGELLDSVTVLGPPAPPPASENQFLLRYDLSYRLRRLRFLLTRIDQLYPLDARSTRILRDRELHAPVEESARREFRRALTDIRAQLSEVLADLRDLLDKLEATSDLNPLAAPVAAIEIDSAQLLSILEGTDDDDRIERAKALVHEHAAAFAKLTGTLEALLKEASIAASERSMQALHSAAVPPAKGGTTGAVKPAGEGSTAAAPAAGTAAAQAQELARHYYEQYEVYDLIIFPILYSTEVGDEIEPVAVHRVSPEDATSIVDERGSGRGKLAGVTLSHFGAFLDRGFRRNDILWGRLDGAERLIAVLLPGDDNQELRAELLRDAQLAILQEEFGPTDQNRLSEIVSQAWLATDASDPNEQALRALAEKQPGATANLGLEAALRQAMSRESLLEFYKTDFEVPRAINPRMAASSLARSTQIVGRILEDLGNRWNQDKRPGAWIARLGGLFWGLVEVAVPRSLGDLLFRHWLKLLYLFEVLLLAGGFLFGRPEVQQLGWKLLGITLVLNLVVALLSDFLTGRTRLRRTLALAVLAAVIGLAVLGAAKLPESLRDWRARWQSSIVPVLKRLLPGRGAAAGTWYFAVSGDSRDCGDLIMPKIAAAIERGKASAPVLFYWHLGDFRRMYDVDCDIAKRARPDYDCVKRPSGPLGDSAMGGYLDGAWRDFVERQLGPFGATPVFLGIGNHELAAGRSRDDFRRSFRRWLTQEPIHSQRTREAASPPQSVDDPAVEKADDAVAVLGVSLRVGDLDDGRPLVVELLEQAHDLLGLGRVQVAGRLVGEQQLGIADHRAGDADQLLLAAGELGGEEVLLADDVEAVERVGHQRLAVGPLDVPVGKRQVEVLGHGQAVEQVVGLEDEADVLLGDLRALLGLHQVDRLAEQLVLAGPGRIEHAEDRQQRRLARAGRPHDGDELPLPHLEVDAAQHVGGAALGGGIGLLDVAQADHGRGLSPPRRS
jgi:patatin-related protein